MTQQLEMIKLIGRMASDIGTLRGSLDAQSPERRKLDKLHDILNLIQKAILRDMIQENNEEIPQITESLNDINQKLQETIANINDNKQSLELIVQLVDAAQEIIGLIP